MNTEEKIKFSLYLVSREDRERLRELVEKIEKLSEKKGIADKLEIIISELINNAVKANLKRLYFQSKGFCMDSQENYDLGLKSFRLNYGHLNFMHYEKAMKLLGLEISVEVDMSDKSTIIFVKNKNTMSDLEEKCLRERLKKIMQELPDQAHDLYMHYGDEMEGNSLGLAMAIDLFQSMGYNPSLLRVYNKGDYTIARIKMPLVSDYTPELEEKSEA